MKNIFINFFKKNNFLVIVKKILKRFEKNTSTEAKKWAIENKKQSIEEFYCSVDATLYNEIKIEIKLIQKFAQNKISKFTPPLGGGGNYILLYFLIRKFKLLNIVETATIQGGSDFSEERTLARAYSVASNESCHSSGSDELARCYSESEAGSELSL